MLTVITFIIVLGILVFVHEFGHFMVARRNGVKAEEFGFGFPPRICGWYKNKHGRRKFFWGSKEVESEDTVYSLNWIPLGGFVKITGEDGEEKNDPQSFSSKPAYVRVKILAAGVAMNVLLAAVLLSVGYFIGIPQAVEDAAGVHLKNEKIQIVETIAGSPADKMGIQVGDQVTGVVNSDGSAVSFSTVEDVQNYINAHKGQEIKLEMKRGNEPIELSGVPRMDYPANEGALGISLVKTAIVSYPWYEALWRGVSSTANLAWMIVVSFGTLLWKLVSGQSVGMDVSGPVGIAVLTGEVARLGFIYILQFTALLSINLAIINILPIPALDGGRILFILIEKFKGSPISQKFEQRAHNIGFALLIFLMVLVTARDVARLDVLEKLKGLF
ncbi:MAG: RIP metalloprotease RseP [Candidatus Moranbacteria bacterium]|nr:RIP metalloprotease RseP [Candidatus Moranbacteria bacterium]